MRLPTGALLIFLVLLLNLLAAAPSLHRLIHADADDADHQCAVTMFAHAQVDTVSVDVPVAVSLTAIETVPVIDFSAFSPFIENLPGERGPPVLPSVS
jgi:hypothetical protein